MDETEAFTKNHWDNLTRNLKLLDQVKTNWWSVIERHYGEKWRFYHTLAHLQKMFQLYDQWKECITDLDVVALAIFFHDIVYDPKAKDNELKSIEIFKKFALEAQLTDPMVSEVCKMIKATISHKVSESATDDLRLFLDFDLSILGESPEVYEEYARNIRKEYIHYKEKDYNKGRVQVLKNLLQNPQLFASKELREDLEQPARKNMEEEIQSLQS